jgi:DNA-binding MarR family transcriptional regulator
MTNSTSKHDAESHLTQEVLQLLVTMGGRLKQRFATRAAEFDLSMSEAKVLMALDPDEALPMRALARKLDYDASNLTGIVDGLEERGAVERRVDESDRRVKAVVLTDRGLQIREALSLRLAEDAGPVGALNHEQLEELRSLLQLAIGDKGGEPSAENNP